MQSFLNGAVSAVFSTFIAFGLAQNDVKPPEPLPVHCERALVPLDAFDRVLAAAEKFEEQLLAEDEKALDEAMDEMGIANTIEQRAFHGAIKLKPLLTSGVLFEAIASEAVARGHKSRKDVESLVRNFALLPIAEKRALVEGVLEGLLFNLNDRIDLSNIKTVRERAERFKMSEAEFSRFLRSWRKLAESDYEEAKLVILDVLRDPSAEVIEGVVKARKKYAGFNWFRRKAPLRPRLEPKKEGGYDDAPLINYMNNTHFGMKSRFMRNHWRELTLGQINKIKDSEVWDELPESLRKEIDTEMELNSRLFAIRETVMEKETRLKDAQIELSELGRPVNELKSTTNVEDVIRIIAATRSMNHETTYQSIKNVLSANADKLSSSDYLRVAQAILTEFSHMTTDSWRRAVLNLMLPDVQAKAMKESDFVKVAEGIIASTRTMSHETTFAVFKNVIEQTKKRPTLSLTAEGAIKKAISDQVAANFNQANWSNSSLSLIAGPLGRKRDRNSEELQAEINELKRELNDARKELAQLTPSVDEQKLLQEKSQDKSED